MSKNTHTSGPWRTTKIGASVKAGDETIATVLEGPQRKANATLLAAAPELLDALRDTVVSIERIAVHMVVGEILADVYANAKNAIAKATGE